MNKQEIIKERDLLLSQTKKYAPVLRPFFESDETLEEYSKNLYHFKIDQVHQKRQDLIKKVIDKKFTKLFGSSYQKELKVNLDDDLAFNIADHHQVLNHPCLIGDNFIGNTEKFAKNEKQDAIIVISSGDVPPNNYFSKNGFRFHDKNIPLFSVSEKESVSYYLPKRKFNFIERLKQIERWSEFSQEEQEFLEKEQKRFDSIDFSKCTDYCDQTTLIVKETWPLMFEEKLRQNLPELLYFSQEEITSKCLIEILKEKNFISECLFNEKFRQKVIENFRGIVVTWRENEDKGTHFFWRKYPGEPRALRMWVKGNQLVPSDERYKDLSVNLDKKSIIELLEKGEIYPSLFLIFSVLNFYSGIKPLVGYGSVIYLNFMKNAWLKTLEDTEFENEIPKIEQIDTNGMIACAPIFFKRIDGKIKTLYAEDIIYEGGISADYLEKSLNMKYGDLLSIAVADLYFYIAAKYIPKSEHLKPTINFNDLAEITFKDL